MTELRTENGWILTGPLSPLRLLTVLMAGLILAIPVQAKPRGGAPGVPVGHFVPVATYQVSGEVAEIVDATPDGKYLIYTDSEEEEVGVVDITDPTDPTEVQTVGVGGQPTCVAITPDGKYALIGIYEGRLLVIDLVTAAQTTIDLGGQPDSVAVSPDGRYAAIAIENERDEDVNDGEMPQDPPGWLTIVDLVGQPSAWALRKVILVGLGRFPSDPEPEFVSIRANNIAAVTLQENNYIALVNLVPLSGNLIGGFCAGTTTHLADLTDDGVISFTELLVDSRLEPDAIGWTPRGNLVTANEGDYDLDVDFVGGRNFTIFAPDGTLLFNSGPATRAGDRGGRVLQRRPVGQQGHRTRGDRDRPLPEPHLSVCRNGTCRRGGGVSHRRQREPAALRPGSRHRRASGGFACDSTKGPFPFGERGGWHHLDL